MTSVYSDAVRVWCWRIPADWNGTDLLDASEHRRAAAYATPELRRRYAASVAFRRQVLGEVLQLPPEAIRFEVDGRGKPSLLTAQNPADWRFNLAHSGDAVLLGVAQGREVGVDIEQVRPTVNWRGVAQTAFSAVEQRAVSDLSAFYSRWTAKEAYLKACGQGLGAPLADITVAVHGEAVEVESPLPGDGRAWWGWSFRPAPDLHAALVVERHMKDSCRPNVVWSTLKEGNSA